MSKFNSHFKMNEEDIILYAKEISFFKRDGVLKAQEIGDGNINYVFRVWDELYNESVVIKQADKLLRSSGRPLDLDRIRIEAVVLEKQGKLAPGLVPKVYHYDPVMCALTMEDISCHENLRKGLLERKTYPLLADHITSFIVNSQLPTTDIIMEPGTKKDFVKRFINKELCAISEDLVFTEPFIDYKGRNVVLEENLEFVQKELYEDRQLILEAGILKNNFKNNPQALIHGDLHSGSIFVTKESTKVIDPEFSFYGPIGYDLGNVIGNLFFAWSNALVTEEMASEDFVIWVAETIENTIELFKFKFITLYKDSVTDVMAKQEEFMNWYLDSILMDTAGVAGLEIIRRVVGDAKVLDITSISTLQARLKAERILIKTGKSFILDRVKFKHGLDYTKEFRKNISKF